MTNTLLYAAILIVLGIVVNGLAGYALAKIKFPFRERWVLVILLLQIVPMETIITIHFLMIAKVGLLNTIVGYILPMIVNPFNIFLFRQVFLSLPDIVAEKLKGRQGELIMGIRGEDIKLDGQNLDLYASEKQQAVIENTEVMGNENNLYFTFGGSQTVARVSKYEISQIGVWI